MLTVNGAISTDNLSVTTSGVSGALFVTFDGAPCQLLYLRNLSGVAIEFQLDGAGVAFPVPNGTDWPVYGISNARSVAVRRIDQAATPVTVHAQAIGG